MKERIGSAIACINLLLSCVLVFIGCRPPLAHITLDWGASVMQPTFCMYRDRFFQERSDIESITVYKVRRSSEEKQRWEVDAPWENGQTVWRLKYKAADTFMKRLLGRQSTSPVCCLTYGEVPPGYQEEVKAVPLEPEQLYIISSWEYEGSPSEDLKFTIYLNDTGIPERLEYHQENFLITYPRDDLRLY